MQIHHHVHLFSFVFIEIAVTQKLLNVTHTVGFAQNSESLWISRMGTPCLHGEAWEDKGLHGLTRCRFQTKEIHTTNSLLESVDFRRSHSLPR
jgi:hypothetical protein